MIRKRNQKKIAGLLIEKLEEKEDGMGGLRHQYPWRKVFYQEIKSWCLVEKKGKRKDCLLSWFFFHIIFSLLLYFYVIKIWERKRDGIVDPCFNELGHGDLILDIIWSCSDERRRRKEGLLLRFLLEPFFSINHEIFLWKKLDIIRSKN